MTNEEKKKLNTFEARVRQLILQYQSLQSEVEHLNNIIADKEHEIEELNNLVESYKQNYQHLKMAKYMEISDGDIKEAKRRMTRLVREVNKCIGLLSSEEVTVS